MPCHYPNSENTGSLSLEAIDEIKFNYFTTFPSNIVTNTGIIKELEMGNMVIADFLHTQEYLVFAHHAIEVTLAIDDMLTMGVNIHVSTRASHSFKRSISKTL